jgi:hypothetical protein
MTMIDMIKNLTMDQMKLTIAQSLLKINDEYDGQLTVEQLRRIAHEGIKLAKLIVNEQK